MRDDVDLQHLRDARVPLALSVKPDSGPGARGVLLGRAYIYALAASGQKGVAHVLALIAEEMRVAMTLIGAKSVHEITRDSLVLAEEELAAEAKAPRAHPGHAAGGRIASRNLIPPMIEFIFKR